MSVFYDLVSQNEVEIAHNIEALGYPEDEAATLETLMYRQNNAPELFLGAYLPSDTGRKLIGYVCSTLSPHPSLTHESMSKHVPGASTICIHSVCVSKEHRRKGIALNLLREYLSRIMTAVRSGASYERVVLLAHEELRGLYEKAGFEWVGLSAIDHGSRTWWEMQRTLTSSSIAPPEEAAEQEPEPKIPPGLWEALQSSSSSRARPQARLLATFPNSVQDLVCDPFGREPESSTNLVDILCPREGCGSIILKKGVASLVERESMQLEPPGHVPHFVLPPPPHPPAKTQWWLVTPNPMAFENIGFSRVVDSSLRSPQGKKLKLLICAECDLGPLGWCEESGGEFWLACDRVGYRAA